MSWPKKAETRYPEIQEETQRATTRPDSRGVRLDGGAWRCSPLPRLPSDLRRPMRRVRPTSGQAGWSDSSHHHHARMPMAIGHETAQARKRAIADWSEFTRELPGMRWWTHARLRSRARSKEWHALSIRSANRAVRQSRLQGGVSRTGLAPHTRGRRTGNPRLTARQLRDEAGCKASSGTTATRSGPCPARPRSRARAARLLEL